jgi:cell division protein FtsB
MTIDDVMRWVNNGIAVVILIYLGYAMWRGGQWLGTNILIPLKDAGLEHLEGINEYMKATAKALDSTAQALQDIGHEVKAMRADFETLRSEVKRGTSSEQRC